MNKFYLGQKVSFNCVWKHIGTIIAYQNAIYQIQCADAVFGMREEDLKGE